MLALLARGSRLAVLVSLAGVLAIGACGDDETVVPEDDGREPACMLLINTEGHWDDGRSRAVLDEFDSGSVAAACVCLDEEEFDSESVREEMADLLLVECERLSGLFEFDWDECQEDHDNGVWLPFVYWAWKGSQFRYLVPSNLPCY